MVKKLEVEYLAPDELKTYENNAKIHTAEQIEQIKSSIREFGFNDPVAVWKDNVIIEGHGRLIAAKELGIEKIPVIRLDDLTDEERRAYILIHNQLTLNTGFDFDILIQELENLKGFDMSKYGFEMPEEVDIDDMFNQPEGAGGTGEEEEEPVEEEPEYVTCPHCGAKVEVE